MTRLLIFLCCCLCLAGHSAGAQDVPYNAKPFGLWLAEFKHDAQAQGIANATLDAAFADTAPIARVIALDRKQPEKRLTLAQYLANTVTPARVQQGRKLFEENEDLLEEIGEHYGVQPQFIVALWGIETGYGSNTGGFNIINALATLAYDGRRSDYFRGELLQALQIADLDHIAPSAMKGSWAGAMGQCQFMPSSFLRYAVDYNHDGHPDIWSNQADVFASIANYLSSSGWRGTEGWGRAVTLPDDFDTALADIKITRPQREWAALGARTAKGQSLPQDNVQSSIIMVGDAPDARSYLIYGNYNVLLKWNRSRYFATAVGMLADKIAQ